MGYDVHITRRTPWWEEEGEQITTQEWAAVVAADPDLKMTQVARVSRTARTQCWSTSTSGWHRCPPTRNRTLTVPG